MPLGVALAVGLDPSLLRTRSQVLQSAGYIVVSASSVKEAVDYFQAGDFDLAAKLGENTHTTKRYVVLITDRRRNDQ